METLLIGALASVATEVVTWINAKLSGTVLKGDGALILSAVVALIISAVKVFSSGAVSLSAADLATAFAQVWATSQIVFVSVIQSLNLDVSSTPAAQ